MEQRDLDDRKEGIACGKRIYQIEKIVALMIDICRDGDEVRGKNKYKRIGAAVLQR